MTVFKKAEISDIDLLVQLRTEVLRAANRLTGGVDMSAVEQETRRYLLESIPRGEQFTYLAFEEGKLAACGSVSFYQVMPTYHNLTGKKAYIMNMYTRPEHRRKGLAIRILDILVQEVRQKGVVHISLEATEAGRALYEKYGFTSMKGEMELL